MFNFPDLTPLLCPRSIAILGASNDLRKVGGMPIQLLRANGFEGAVYPVHLQSIEIQGLCAYPSLNAIGKPIDLVIIALPAAACELAIAQVCACGARAAIILSSGFAETNEAGVAMQTRLAQQAFSAGVLILGPNCLGAMNLRGKVFSTFSPMALAGAPKPGRVALVSQSGAVGGYAFAMAKQQNLGLSHWITTGNEAGVQVADALHWLAFDPDTDLIMTYIEGARDMVRLRAALQANKKAGKAVVMMKVGFTEAGRKAALAHTASHTGDDDEFAALLSEFGVHRVANLSELIRITRVLDFAHSLSQLNICDKAPSTAQPQSTALLSISGGAGIMMADRAEQLGLSLPTFPHDAAQRLQVAISFSSAANPIDVTGQVFSQPEVLTQAIEDAALCGLYTNLVIFLAGAALIPTFWAKLQTCLSDLRNRSSNVNTVFCGIVSAEQTAWLESHGCLVTSDPVDAVDVVALLSGHRLPYRIKS
jgi:acyl-CoA synthetase (NDP forming)